MLIMQFIVLSIGSIQYVMKLLEDIMHALNEIFLFFCFRLHMSRINLSIDKWHGYVNGT